MIKRVPSDFCEELNKRIIFVNEYSLEFNETDKNREMGEGEKIR